MKFQIGDRVRLVSECADINHTPNSGIPCGSTGTIIDIMHEGRYGVSFDGCTSGHHCRHRLTGDKCKSGYYVSEFELEFECAYEPDDSHLNIASLL